MNRADPATRWPLVLLLVGAAVVAAFQIGKAPAALPAIRADLGLDLVAASWVVAIFNLLGLAIGMATGGLAERIGHRRVALAGLALIVVASAAGAAAPGGATLLATRSLEGIGFLAVIVAVPTLIVGATAPGDRALAFGFWSSYMPVGTAAMMVAAPALLTPFGWRGLWLANAALLAIYALAFARATAAAPAPRASATPQSETIRSVAARSSAAVWSLAASGKTTALARTTP